MLAIAAAALDEDGTLIEANAGFQRLISVEGLQQIGMRIPSLFIQPDFAALMRGQAESDGQVHRGLLTLGDRLGRTRSLTGRVWRINGRLHVLAEYRYRRAGANSTIPCLHSTATMLTRNCNSPRSISSCSSARRRSLPHR